MGHTPGESPIDGRVFVKEQEVPRNLDPVVFRFGESELMVYEGGGGIAMHTHITYEIQGIGQQPGGPSVPSNELVLKVDARGDRPQPGDCDDEWGEAASGALASLGDCGCGCGSRKTKRH